MYRLSHGLKALAAAALVLCLGVSGATAQTIGDVGRDRSGNVYTFGYDAQGNRVWLPGVAQGPVVSERVIQAERYTPTIWVDPDGCEHWVMDDGVEGFMTPHVTREGIPVCNRSSSCGSFPGDVLFASGEHWITDAGKQAIMQFFASAGASSYGVIGHTDSQGGDAYNMGLSQRRAQMVASVAQQVGARIVAVSGQGERAPVASNAHAQGRAANRRVEIVCYR